MSGEPLENLTGFTTQIQPIVLEDSNSNETSALSAIKYYCTLDTCTTVYFYALLFSAVLFLGAVFLD